MSDLGKKFQQIKKEFYKSIKSDHTKFKSESEAKIKKIKELVCDLQKISDEYGFPIYVDLGDSRKGYSIEVEPYDMMHILTQKYGEVTVQDLNQATGESIWVSSSMSC